MSLREIALLNKLTTRSKVRIGQNLKLEKTRDVVVSRVSAQRRERKPAAAPIVYRLGNGETLTDVARWFGKSVTEIKTANSIKKGRSLHVGAKVKIPDTRSGTYTVRRGDYVIKVAQKFNLNQTALMKLNNLKRAQLVPGQRLVVNLE
jgi:LysM repeat protein